MTICVCKFLCLVYLTYGLQARQLLCMLLAVPQGLLALLCSHVFDLMSGDERSDRCEQIESLDRHKQVWGVCRWGGGRSRRVKHGSRGARATRGACREGQPACRAEWNA